MMMVRVEPEAYVTMILHAANHSTKVVHGILVGYFPQRGGGKNEAIVRKVVPVCHETPTKPLVEMALRLTEAMLEEEEEEDDKNDKKSSTILGWYTAPQTLSDESPGPTALRIVANMAAMMHEQETISKNEDPVLIVLNNRSVTNFLSAKDDTDDDVTSSSQATLAALGRDFGQQWLEPLQCSITQDTEAKKAARDAYKKRVGITDLVDHWESPKSNVDGMSWMENLHLSAVIAEFC